MDFDSYRLLYPSVRTTGLMSEEDLIKEINSLGCVPSIRADLKQRLLVLRNNGFDLA